MKQIDIDNELKESMLFDSGLNTEQIFANIIARATKEKSEEVAFLKLKTKLGNLWLIKSGFVSQFAVKYDKELFYATPGFNMENIYVTMNDNVFNEAIAYADSKEGKAYYKELHAWLLSSFKNIAKGNKPVGKIFDYPANRNCIYDFYNYNVIAA